MSMLFSRTAIMLVVWKEHSPTVAEVLHHVETSRTE